MKNFIYILVDIVFFNLSAWLLYYLGLVNNTSLVIFDSVVDIIITNLVIFVSLWIYLSVYNKFLIRKFNYFKIAVLGLFIGIVVLFFVPNAVFQEKLFIVLFTSFALTFLSYSVYFDGVKLEVFK